MTGTNDEGKCGRHSRLPRPCPPPTPCPPERRLVAPVVVRAQSSSRSCPTLSSSAPRAAPIVVRARRPHTHLMDHDAE